MTTPYELAKSLFAKGLDREAVREELKRTGLDTAAANVVINAVTGVPLMELNDDLEVGLTPRLGLFISWRKHSWLGANHSIVFGAVKVLLAFGLAIGWALLGKSALWMAGAIPLLIWGGAQTLAGLRRWAALSASATSSAAQ